MSNVKMLTNTIALSLLFVSLTFASLTTQQAKWAFANVLDKNQDDVIDASDLWYPLSYLILIFYSKVAFVADEIDCSLVSKQVQLLLHYF